MKKVMLFLAAIALVVGVQGAAVTWKMGTGIKAPNADGSVGSVNAATGTLSMYVWLVDQATYDATSLESIVADYSGKLDTATSSVTGKGGSMGGQTKTDGLSFSTTESTTYYGLVLTEY